MIERAQGSGVVASVITGSCLRTSRAAQQLAEQPQPSGHALYFTAGVHPHNAKARVVGTCGWSVNGLQCSS